MSLANLLSERAIEQTIYRYARACDQRDWKAMTSLFAPDSEAHYTANFSCKGRDAIIQFLSSVLGRCGPTQHLVGNVTAHVNGDGATCRSYFRALHTGIRTAEGLILEGIGEYHDRLNLTPQGWVFKERTWHSQYYLGSPEVLALSEFDSARD